MSNLVLNKRQRIPKGKSKIDNPEKLATQDTELKEKKQSKNRQPREAGNIEYRIEGEKKSKNRTQYVLDITIRKQTQIT